MYINNIHTFNEFTKGVLNIPSNKVIIVLTVLD